MKIYFSYFHIARASRERYGIDSALFAYHSRLIVARFRQAREIAEKINNVRKTEIGAQYVTPGLINGAALLHEIAHHLIREHTISENPGVLSTLLNHLQSENSDSLQQLFLEFINVFPPQEVYNGSVTPLEYLNAEIDGLPASEIILEEMILLHLENRNKALSPIKEFFEFSLLEHKETFQKAMNFSSKFFGEEAQVKKGGVNFFEFLLRPILEYPESLDGQLDYLLSKSGVKISDFVTKRVLLAKDLIAEDSKIFFVNSPGGAPTPPVPVYLPADAASLNPESPRHGPLRTPTIDEISQSYYSEDEQFTTDLDWMPRVVMIAKNTYVWLDQLSKQYGRPIRTLDLIPDEELDKIKSWNFTALWLIGVWQRSSASKKIKQFCGNHDAVSSAYSVYDYDIAVELGGYYAYENLRNRCSARGIRLASDMVPNHTGIFSKWVLSHPEYFIQAERPPYPNYSFSGPDLSENPDVELRIEDKYYTKADAAVVFERKDKNTGQVRYLYHGNDGTNMPWNDTAQLNILIPEVREALIQEIKRIASLFPIIRFDAAMTLSKKHFQRLWFPQPGTGGAIPSRSDYSMDRNTFDILMPAEFWREVVDRINAELPHTLLLAEAFWLMEGYFVRTLGMHRVYNSAFMHMFMKEENTKYKELIKNTLEFNPEILKRYVNFMSNPDEETAVNQFGKGDKYIGVCVMMVTLPGLPMFAHGQIEGLTEKYGMEYQRAYYNEFADEYLIDRHKREIFPLVSKRMLFSEVANFRLYDFFAADGRIDENVFVFTNYRNNQHVLVCYNNAYLRSAGTVRYSSPKILGDAYSSTNVQFESLQISEVLNAENNERMFFTAYETRSSKSYLFRSDEIFQNGIRLELNGYEYKVFLFQGVLFDHSGRLEQLYSLNPARGYENIDTELNKLRTASFHEQLEHTLSGDFLTSHFKYLRGGSDSKPDLRDSVQDITIRISSLLSELKHIGYQTGSPEAVLAAIENDFSALRGIVSEFSKIIRAKKNSDTNIARIWNKYFLQTDESYLIFLTVYIILRQILLSVRTDKSPLGIYEDLMLKHELWQILIRSCNEYAIVYDEFHALDILFRRALPTDSETGTAAALGHESGFIDEIINEVSTTEVKEFIGCNLYNGVEYFNKEKLVFFTEAIYFIVLMEKSLKLSTSKTKAGKAKAQVTIHRELNELVRSNSLCMTEIISYSDQSGYIYEEFVKSLRSWNKPPGLNVKLQKQPRPARKKVKKKKPK